MAYKVIILYQLYMPSYFLGTFTEYPDVRPSVFPISASSMLINELSVLTEYSIRNVVF